MRSQPGNEPPTTCTMKPSRAACGSLAAWQPQAAFFSIRSCRGLHCLLAPKETHLTTSASTALGLLAAPDRNVWNRRSSWSRPWGTCMFAQAVLKQQGASGQGSGSGAATLVSPRVKQDHLLHDLCSQQSSMLMGSCTSGMFSNASLL